MNPETYQKNLDYKEGKRKPRLPLKRRILPIGTFFTPQSMRNTTPQQTLSSLWLNAAWSLGGGEGPAGRPLRRSIWPVL
jgi:hypothetical protein